MTDSNPSPADFRPAATLDTLRQRAALLAALRQHFTAAGYWEVETPILSHDTVVDAWLEPFVTRDETRAAPAELYMQTSPEFGMKRLLAAGARRIFQITRAFRQGESGPLHNPEFTLAEWYRAGDTYEDQMTFVEELVSSVFRRGTDLRQTPVPVFLRQVPFERLTYDAAFVRHVGTTVLDRTAGELADLARQHSVPAPATLGAADRDGWLNLLLAELVEPHLGINRPTFLYDYPASQAALATIRGGDPPVAERFELYAAGIELCNGYQELTDPAELEQRIARQSQIRAAAGLRPLPARNRLLAAMRSGLPACSGVALGFDRLAMLALGKQTLDEIMAFPGARA